jgi:hypothetical protein
MGSGLKMLRWLSFNLVLVTLAACAQLSPVESTQAKEDPAAKTTQSAAVVPLSEQEVPGQSTQVAAPEEIAPCASPSLGIQVSLPGHAWECLNDTTDWLTLRSPNFEIQMSMLGRGPFCSRPDIDESCVREPFYADDFMELEAWSSFGEVKEIFGLTQHSQQGARMWISVKYQERENRVLCDQEMDELSQLLRSLSPTS